MRVPSPFPALAPRHALGLAALALLACAAPPKAGPIDADACGASGLQHLLGETEAALAAMSFPAGGLRVIRPGMAVTQDYRAERLNIALDAAGYIVRVYCG